MKAVSVNSQSLLAKLLATENISVQYKNGIKTAMFDLKNRVLMLPIWENISEDLRHLLIGHETGHALDTPSAEEYKRSIEMMAAKIFGANATLKQQQTVGGFLNVVEDVRIDNRQKRRYPGLRKNYLHGYKELIERDFFGTKQRDVNSMNFIDRANIYFKGGSIHHKIDFTPEERVLLNRMEKAETFDDVLTVTEDVYRYCKGKIDNPDHELILELPTDDFDEEWDDVDFGDDWDDEGEESDDDSDEDGDSSDAGDDESDGSEDDEGTEESAGGKSSRDNKGGKDNGKEQKAGPTEQEKLPESETDKSWNDKVQSLVKDDNTEYVYCQFPDVDYKEAIHGYKQVLAEWRKERDFPNRAWGWTIDRDSYKIFATQFAEWKRKEKESISFLVKEFEMRKSAEIYSRISIAKTGVIDTNKLHSYRYNDDIFRRLSVIPEGKNHGFVMFIDWSGSMDSDLRHTLKQLFTLVLFCKQIQVPFEVYLFKDSGCAVPWKYNAKIQNEVGLQAVCLREVLSSRMNATELNEAMTFLWGAGNGGRLISDGMSGTPLNEAIVLAPKVINDFRRKFKLEIVNTIFLTDGESNSLSGLRNPSFQKQPLKQYRYFYNEPTTGKTHEIYPQFAWGELGEANTNTFLRILKDKTGSNLIGFFLWSSGWSRFVGRFRISGDGAFIKKVETSWKNDKFYAVKSHGYDDYYVIDTKAMSQEQNELDITGAKTTKGIAKAFSKFAAKKTVNRVLLRQFIDKVTSQANSLA